MHDRRSVTSVENGKAGGRPPIIVKDIAEQFLLANRTKGVHTTLRRYKTRWYVYNGNHWVPLSDNDLEAQVMGFLQENYPTLRTSSSLRDDVIENLASDKLCGMLEERYEMPCFISTGKSAKGWLPMTNGMVNIDIITEAKRDGLPVPPTALISLSPDLFVTYGLGYGYDPDAKCPMWERYLLDVQPNQDNRDMLQMLAGLSLVADTSYNVFFMLAGPAGCGKSVFLHILSKLVGD